MNYRIAARKAADALYYLSKRIHKDNPWPPIRKIYYIIRVKIIMLARKVFKRKTCKTIIHPIRFKGWKGER